MAAKTLKKSPKPSGPVRPSKRDRAATMEKLLQAATEVFSKLGYDGATTKEVAKRAKVNEALIQRYFDGKEGLLYAVMDRFKNHGEERCSDIPPPRASFAEDVKVFLDYHLNHLTEDGALMRVAVSRAIVDPKLRKMMRQHWLHELLPSIQTRIEYWQSKGEVSSEIKPIGLAFTLLGLAFELGFFGQNVMSLDDETVHNLRSEILKIVLRASAPD